MVMITIYVVDRLAENRTNLVEEITRHFRSTTQDIDLLPRVNILPLAREELKFHPVPDLCIIGSGIVEGASTEVSAVRKLLPASAILARLKSGAEELAFVEQLARIGIDDVVSDQTSSSEFLKKVILLSRRVAKKRGGKLILVDGGKGGTGVTSIAAACGDALARRGKRTALLDFDCDTQDLSRFLQARPFVNENLQLLFDQARPLTQEFVEQALVTVWEDEPLLRCMPPVSESDGLFDGRSTYSRTLISVVEILDEINDFVIVDAGSARGTFLKTLYRLADVVLFVTNNDPASLFASADRLRKMKSHLSPDAELVLISNRSAGGGISERFLQDELSELCGNAATDKIPLVRVPACKSATKWPGSGGTIYSQGTSEVRRSVESILIEIGATERPAPAPTARLLVPALRESFVRLLRKSQINSLQSKPALAFHDHGLVRTQEPTTNVDALAQLPAPILYRSQEVSLSGSSDAQASSAQQPAHAEQSTFAAMTESKYSVSKSEARSDTIPFDEPREDFRVLFGEIQFS